MMPAAGRGSRAAIWSWALYDFANSPFTTLVVTFVYAIYFTEVVASDSNTGTVLWSRAVTITAIVVAFASPVLGALADRGGYRKRFIAIATAICVVATTALYAVEPGEVVAALVLVIIANIAFEFATVFYNAFLPDVAEPKRIGAVSGIGWGLGYIGGLIVLVIALYFFVLPEEPIFGLTTENGENVRATNVLVAAWFVVFSIPLFVWVKEDKSLVSRPGAIAKESWIQLKRTFAEIRKYRQIVRFLVARLVYNDALVTIFAFGGIYAAGTFGLSLEQTLVFGIVINLAAGVGAVAMGYLDDRIGAKRTIVISLLGLIVATIIAVTAADVVWLWVAGVLIGIFSGPNQAASRSLMGRFVPPRLENEFFGFFAFSGKLTAFLGPFLLGLTTQVTGTQRLGVAVILVLFLIGLVLLMFVDEQEGAALREQALVAARPEGESG